MKLFAFSALAVAAAAFLASPQLPAAQQVANFAEARNLVSDDGYIIVAYADGWDNYSQKRCQKLMADEAFLKAAGKAVLIPLPIPDLADEARRQQQAAVCGELQVPDANSYPALIFFDKKGVHYATLYGSAVSRGNAAKVAERLAKTMAAGRERSRLLASAEAASGPDRAKILLKAYQIDGLTRAPEGLAEQLTALDPQDTSGARRVLAFNPYAFATGLDKKEMEVGLAEVDAILNDPLYSTRQKQQACVAAVGMLRRVAGVKGGKELRRYAELMRKLDPETAEGRSASHILSHWVPVLRYIDGWTPAGIPTDDTPIELEGSLPIGAAGTYTVTFEYTRGAEALIITAVELYDGKTKVAEDRHRGVTGNSHENNVYTLELSKPVAEPHLLITTDMKNRDTYGRIRIERK